MPDFTYQGAAPGLYPMLRDAYGVLAGTVTPGDVLEFSEAPDADWVPYEGGGTESEPGPADVPAAGGRDHENSDDEAGVTGEED